jgi:Mrp family chromosome partitioning ATPase
MNAPRNPKGGGSLIERAAGAYGLTDFARRPDAIPAARPPFVAPELPAAFAEPRIHAPVATPAPAPAPVAPTPKPASAARPASYGPVAGIDRKMLAEGGNIVPGAPVSVLAEEFRLVKRQLLLTARSLKADPAKARSILICSARPDEGKTFCAINLAISLAAERDTEVLLIDGDFAKRDLMPRMGLSNGPGFLDALADRALDPERLVTRTDIPQLSLLGAGSRTNDDTELLASARTREVIDRLLAADPNRILLFDSPPALAASPAGVFALHVGQVMVVVRADSTSDNEIRDAVALLDGCDHIQLVLNKVRHQPSGYRFGDYYTPTEDTK